MYQLKKVAAIIFVLLGIVNSVSMAGCKSSYLENLDNLVPDALDNALETAIADDGSIYILVDSRIEKIDSKKTNECVQKGYLQFRVNCEYALVNHVQDQRQ